MARQGHVNIQRGCLSTTRQQFSYIDVNTRRIYFVLFFCFLFFLYKKKSSFQIY